ncbi:hypothetical protein [Streptomyces sp. SGAir0957]
MARNFISEKTAEATAAMQRGDGQRAAQVITEAIKENTGTFQETVTAMTQAAKVQKGR